MAINAAAILTLVLAAGIGFAQELCIYHCIPEEAFSAKNIHRIHGLGAEGPWGILDVRWHRTEPLIFILSNWRSGSDQEISGSDLEVWEFGETKDYTRYALVNGPFTQLEVIPDTVVIGTDSGSLLFWDMKQGEFTYDEYLSDGGVSELLLHPSDEWLLAAIDGSRLFHYDLESQTAAEIHLQGVEELAKHALAFSNDGQLLAIGGDEKFGIWDSSSWAPWEPQRLPAESVNDLLFEQDGAHLIVVADTSVSRWSLANNRLTFVLEFKRHPARRLCRFVDGDISPDGTLLMTTDSCSQLRAWDLTSDAEIFISGLDWSDDRNPGTAVGFSPDGLLLAEVKSGYWSFMLIPALSPNERYVSGDGNRG